MSDAVGEQGGDVVIAAPSETAAETVAKAIRAAIVAGAGPLPAGYDLTIVVEGRAFAADGASSDAVLGGYAAGADLYLRVTPDVDFPAGAKVLTLGVEVQQKHFSGFCAQEGYVNVGPAFPAYAGANLAYQKGATVIDIYGLSPGEKDRLKPWLDELPTHAVEPAQVAVSTL